MSQELSRDRVIKYGSNKIGKVTSVTQTGARNIIARNNFDSGNWERKVGGRWSGSLTINFELDDSDTNGQRALFADIHNPEKRVGSDYDTFTYGPETPTAGDIIRSGSGIPSNFSIEGGDDGDGLIRGSFEIEIDGEWSETVES